MPRDSEQDASKLFPNTLRITFEDMDFKLDEATEALVRPLDDSVVRHIELTMRIERDFAVLLCGCTVYIDFGQVRSKCAEAERLYEALCERVRTTYNNNTNLVVQHEGETYGRSVLMSDEAQALLMHFDEFRQKHPDSLRRALDLHAFAEHGEEEPLRPSDVFKRGDESIKYDPADERAVVFKREQKSARAVEVNLPRLERRKASFARWLC